MRHACISRGFGVGCLALAVLAVRAGAQEQALRLHGVSLTPGLGQSISFLGDVNGDGVPDYVSGGWSVQETDLGHVMVCSGADGSTLFDIGGAQHANFGWAVASAGDVDADGIDDFAVGAPSDHDGTVYLYSGATGALLRTVSSTSKGSQLGTSLANLGDLDGDGVADLAVGAPAFKTNGSPLGLAVIYSGATGSVLAQWTGASPNGYFGTVVGDAGDVDGDGLRDLLVVEEADATSGTASGTVRIFSTKTLLALQQWVLGPHAYDWNAAVAGDVNGDGTVDIIANNIKWPWTYIPPYTYYVGGVWIIDGATGTQLVSLTNFFLLSNGICGAGDVDGDGFDDFVYSLDWPSSESRVISGKTGAVLVRAPGIAVSMRSGVDMNGDGVSELAVGVPSDSSVKGYGSGAAKIFDPVGQTFLAASYGDTRIDLLGEAVALLDDVDGDGTRDLLVGTGGNSFSLGVARILSGVDGSELRSHRGAALLDSYACSVAALPDLDGDAIGEYAIAFPGLAGAKTGVIEIRAGATGNLIRSLSPAGGGDGDFGACLSAAIQPSGAVELGVGAPTYPNGGTAFVFDVSTGNVLVNATPIFTRDKLGTSVTWIGDVDGDGTGDWAAGSPVYPFGIGLESVVVFSGKTGATLKMLTAPGYTGFGSAVCGPGDLDGDGTPDLYVGAPADSAFQPGLVYLFSGKTWSVLQRWPGNSNDHYLGQSITAIGDVNHDGLGEVLFGSDGRAQLVSGGTGGVLFRFSGSSKYDGFSYRPAGVAAPGSSGSMNGDTIPDVAIGAYLDDAKGFNAGRLSLYLLDDLYLQIFPPTAKAGDTVLLTTSGAPTGNLAGLFLLAFDGSPLVAPVAFGTLDSEGRWTQQGVVPNGLAGHEFTFGSFAKGFTGKLTGTQAMTLEFQ